MGYLTPAQRGQAGEAVACAYLASRGWTLLERHYTCRYGELDIIARTPEDNLVFIEVKTYKHQALVSGRLAITRHKQRCLVRTVQHFLGYHPVNFDITGMRIDLILATPAVVLEHLSNVIDGTVDWQQP